MNVLTAVSLCGLLALAFSAPAEERPPEINPKEYLIKYQLLSVENQDDPTAFQKAVIRLQKQGGLPETGRIDAKTKELMELPRYDFRSTPQLADYKLHGSTWRNKSVTYSIRDYTDDMTKQQQREEIRRAFKVWSDVSSLTFTEITPNTGDIEIRFARLNHGDNKPFDGPSGTLAHAYFPAVGGDAHFDDDEGFTFNTSRGINLFQVVAHELGHCLGLEHSDDQNALMAAFYRGYQRHFILGDDDIGGIQELYGQNVNIPQPDNSPQQPDSPDEPDYPSEEPFCMDSRLDAMFSIRNRKTYGFRGSLYYRFNDNGLVAGYPRKISRWWPGLPNNINAAISLLDISGREEIWFFKGAQIYVHGTNGKAIRRPSNIFQTIPGLPNDIDSIFKWPGNNRIYAFKGTQYYRLATTNDRVESGYPVGIDAWTEHSSEFVKEAFKDGGIDAVFTYTNGKSYFFKGQEYYRYNTDSPPRFDSGYPRPISYWWFGCAI